MSPAMFCLVSGAILMAAELVIPGGIVFFLGLSSIVVGIIFQLGIIQSVVVGITLWFIIAIVLLVIGTQITHKLFGGDSHIDNTDEDLDLYGKIATVIDTIGPSEHMGRISFLGTTWSALGDGSEIKAGSKVKIICRDNIAFIVESIAIEEA